MKKILLFAVISVVIVSVSVTSIYAQSQTDIPAWVKGVANFWVEGNISDSEFGESISFLKNYFGISWKNKLLYLIYYIIA